MPRGRRHRTTGPEPRIVGLGQLRPDGTRRPIDTPLLLKDIRRMLSSTDVYIRDIARNIIGTTRIPLPFHRIAAAYKYHWAVHYTSCYAVPFIHGFRTYHLSHIMAAVDWLISLCGANMPLNRCQVPQRNGAPPDLPTLAEFREALDNKDERTLQYVRDVLRRTNFTIPTSMGESAEEAGFFLYRNGDYLTIRDVDSRDDAACRRALDWLIERFGADANGARFRIPPSDVQPKQAEQSSEATDSGTAPGLHATASAGQQDGTMQDAYTAGGGDSTAHAVLSHGMAPTRDPILDTSMQGVAAGIRPDPAHASLSSGDTPSPAQPDAVSPDTASDAAAAVDSNNVDSSVPIVCAASSGDDLVPQTIQSVDPELYPPLEVMPVPTHLLHTQSVLVPLIRRLEQRFVGGTRSWTRRVAPRGLVREMVTRRWSRPYIYARQAPPAVILILVDCSGSCSDVCGDLMYEALAVCAACPAVVIVEHGRTAAEGIPWRLYGHQAQHVAAAIMRGRHRQPHLAWGHCWSTLDVRAVIALGDWHGAHYYLHEIAPYVPLYWLDHYTSRSVGTVRDQTARRELWVDYPARPACYLVGVGSIEQLQAAATQLLRGPMK